MTATNPKVSFKLAASHESPLLNPAFVLKQWEKEGNAVVKASGRTPQTGMRVRQGTTYDTDGTRQRIIWLELEAETPVELFIE